MPATRAAAGSAAVRGRPAGRAGQPGWLARVAWPYYALAVACLVGGFA